MSQSFSIRRARFWLFLIAAAVGAGGTVILSRPIRAGDNPSPAAHASDLAKLRDERVDTLKKAVDLANQLYSRGLGDFAVVSQCDRQMFEAKLDAAATPQDRIAVLRQSKDDADKTEKLAQDRFKAGLTSELDVTMATADRQKVEIQLAEELAK
jgi:outer membrane protein TolC